MPKAYGSFPTCGDPNIDPQIFQSSLWGPPKIIPNFRELPVNVDQTCLAKLGNAGGNRLQVCSARKRAQGIVAAALHSLLGFSREHG